MDFEQTKRCLLPLSPSPCSYRVQSNSLQMWNSWEPAQQWCSLLYEPAGLEAPLLSSELPGAACKGWEAWGGWTLCLQGHRETLSCLASANFSSAWSQRSCWRWWRWGQKCRGAREVFFPEWSWTCSSLYPEEVSSWLYSLPCQREGKRVEASSVPQSTLHPHLCHKSETLDVEYRSSEDLSLQLWSEQVIQSSEKIFDFRSGLFSLLQCWLGTRE